MGFSSPPEEMILMRIDTTDLVRVEEVEGDSAKDTELIRQLERDAKHFVESFSWCTGIRDAFFGLGVGGILGVFLYQIIPASIDVDEWLWVVVGDVPPAYLVVDQSPTPRLALATYVYEMQRWVDTVKERGTVEDCIPVNVEPTADNANALEKRLDF